MVSLPEARDLENLSINESEKALLFCPIKLEDLLLRNRIVVAPMVQYSAVNGCMGYWHQMHLGQLAISGAGIVIIEATAVSPEGRISYADVGLWDIITQRALGTTLTKVKSISDTPIALQLAHAGRKGSVEVSWLGGKKIGKESMNGWTNLAPSPVPFEGRDLPKHLDKSDIRRLRVAFATAAKMAAEVGVDAIQLHAAHGYLLHQFLSPLSNVRSDEYGGSLSSRMCFPLDVFEAVRQAFPPGRPVSVRISGTDWAEGGWSVEDSVVFAQELEKRGVSAIHVSSGGLTPSQKVDVGPGYQVGLASIVKSSINIPVVTVGLITEFEQAERILREGHADLIALGRALLCDPRWPWRAAAYFRVPARIPVQYNRIEHMF